jgi:uncharacterized membrane protein YczE
MKVYALRTTRLIFGLFLFGLGSFLTIQANIGLAPWEAFSMGLHYLTGLSYGNVVVLSGLIIVGIDLLYKEKIGFGTFLNALLIGTFVDVIAWFEVIPQMQSFWAGLPMMLLGLFVVCLASYFYIGAGLGCGPRDALMVALCKRMNRAPVGVIRSGMEGTVLLIGWLLGAKVGPGTIISVFGIGFIIQFTFKLLRFDVKGVVHENIIDTSRALARLMRKDRPSRPLEPPAVEAAERAGEKTE